MLADKLRCGTSNIQDLVLVFNTVLGDLTIELPLNGTVAAVVDWGDGTTNTYTSAGIRTKTYATHGTYTVRISGTVSRFGSDTALPRPEMTRCLSFGKVGLTSLAGAFRDCANLTRVPKQIPPGITSFKDMFLGAGAFNQDIGSWATNDVTDMSRMFQNASLFNADIGGWNTTNVTSTSYMFFNATSFNKDISGWNTTNVVGMDGMFANAAAFDQNIGGWVTSNVTNMEGMFNGASNFNKGIASWDTSKVLNMNYMFTNAVAFNQPIGAWDTAGVVTMEGMFQNAVSFNQNLTNWCVGNFQNEPSNFSTGSGITVINKPIWGTCPARIAAGAMTYIGAATGVSTATLPTHQVSDLILAFAFRDGSSALPTMPAGWTLIDTAFGNTCSARVAYRVAESNSEVAGSWTSATTVIFLVYRGVNIENITNIDTKSTGDSAVVTYNANGFWKGLSRLVTFVGHRSTDTAIDTVPGDLSLITSVSDSTDQAAAFQSLVDNYGDWPSTNVAVNGTPSGWITFSLRLRVPILPAL
jgi:surface protein